MRPPRSEAEPTSTAECLCSGSRNSESGKTSECTFSAPRNQRSRPSAFAGSYIWAQAHNKMPQGSRRVPSAVGGQEVRTSGRLRLASIARQTGPSQLPRPAGAGLDFGQVFRAASWSTDATCRWGEVVVSQGLQNTRPNPSLELTRSGRRRKAAPRPMRHFRSAALRRLPPRSAQLQR
jgi:hypothetical protein